MKLVGSERQRNAARISVCMYCNVGVLWTRLPLASCCRREQSYPCQPKRPDRSRWTMAIFRIFNAPVEIEILWVIEQLVALTPLKP